MRIVDNSTGQLLNSVSYGYTMYYLAGQADGTVYLYDGSGKIYYIDVFCLAWNMEIYFKTSNYTI